MQGGSTRINACKREAGWQRCKERVRPAQLGRYTRTCLEHASHDCTTQAISLRSLCGVDADFLIESLDLLCEDGDGADLLVNPPRGHLPSASLAARLRAGDGEGPPGGLLHVKDSVALAQAAADVGQAVAGAGVQGAGASRVRARVALADALAVEVAYR